MTFSGTLCPLLLLTGYFSWVAAATAGSPFLSNLQASQRPGTKFVDLTYDLVDADTTALSVRLLISRDSGLTWTVPALSLSGAIGPNVAPGQHLTLTWQAGADWDGRSSTTLKFRLIADQEPAPPPLGFAFIPEGTYQMGDQSLPSPGSVSPDLPVHTVTLSPFYLHTTEITKAQWDAGYTYAAAHGYSFENPGQGKADTHPVHSISWFDAVKWCNARSQQDGLQPCYRMFGLVYQQGTGTYQDINRPVICDFKQNGYRLPTESEWERAARGGLDGKRFPWGDTISHFEANYFSYTYDAYDNSFTMELHPLYATGLDPCTSPVGSFPSNGLGIFDMAGNLAEWCWDSYGAYPAEPTTDPTGYVPPRWNMQVVRGGSWRSPGRLARVSARDYGPPGWGSVTYGFRVARSGPPNRTSADTGDVSIDTRSPLPTDGDTDGIPAVWEATHGFADDESGDAWLDYDGDGLNNRQEYFAGTDPRDASSSLKINHWSVSPVLGPGGKELVLSWASVPGHHYAVQQSTDLHQWTPLASGVAATPPLNTMVRPLPSGAAAAWYRVLVEEEGDLTPPPGFVRIPADAFAMGSSQDALPEAKVHTVHVSAFFLQTTEVTKPQWDETFYHAISRGYGFDHGGVGQAGLHPLSNISWYDAVKWCNARSQQDDLQPCYYTNGDVYRTGQVALVTCDFSKNGYRLPTEAEWEKAARGGLNGSRFPWGETITHARANYYSSGAFSYDLSTTRGRHPTYSRGYPETAPVGTFPPNGLGLYDMAGNVAEWCWDGFAAYPGPPVSNPQGPASSGERVVRGGSCSGLASEARVSSRARFSPFTSSLTLGFRLARSSR